jgi:tetratricopeptide (TPR) repeat protein
LAEELRTALSRIPELKVVARTSSEKVRHDDIPTAARKLEVGNILTGSVRRSASMIRVNAQLIGGKDGLERWSEAYDRPVGDTLQIQADIAQKVAAALSIELGASERTALTLGGTGDPEAQDRYLKASDLLLVTGSEDSLQKAVRLLDEATRIDPKFAEAHAAKGRALRTLASQFASSAAEFDPGLDRAEAAAREALRHAPGLKSAYVTLASTRSAKLDFKGALAYFRKADVAASQDTSTILTYAWFVGNLGRAAEAIELINRATANDPLNPWPYEMKAWMLYVARRYAESVSTARDLLKWSPGRPYTLNVLGFSSMLLGKPGEARTAFAQMAPDSEWRTVGEGILAARTGDRAASERALSRLRGIAGDALSYQYAQIHAQMGEREQALAALDRAVEVRDPGLIFLPTDPFLDPLRSDPRFKALVGKLDYP